MSKKETLAVTVLILIESFKTRLNKITVTYHIAKASHGNGWEGAKIVERENNQRIRQVKIAVSTRHEPGSGGIQSKQHLPVFVCPRNLSRDKQSKSSVITRSRLLSDDSLRWEPKLSKFIVSENFFFFFSFFFFFFFAYNEKIFFGLMWFLSAWIYSVNLDPDQSSIFRQLIKLPSGIVLAFNLSLMRSWMACIFRIIMVSFDEEICPVNELRFYRNNPKYWDRQN